jgi:hypothetical protein
MQCPQASKYFQAWQKKKAKDAQMAGLKQISKQNAEQRKSDLNVGTSQNYTLTVFWCLLFLASVCCVGVVVWFCFRKKHFPPSFAGSDGRSFVFQK